MIGSASVISEVDVGRVDMSDYLLLIHLLS
jgi:hypothetical protein